MTRALAPASCASNLACHTRLRVGDGLSHRNRPCCRASRPSLGGHHKAQVVVKGAQRQNLFTGHLLEQGRRLLGGMSSSASAHAHLQEGGPVKRSRSTNVDAATPNKHARVAASPSSIEGVRKLQKILPQRLNITSPRTRSQVISFSLRCCLYLRLRSCQLQ